MNIFKENLYGEKMEFKLWQLITITAKTSKVALVHGGSSRICSAQLRTPCGWIRLNYYVRSYATIHVPFNVFSICVLILSMDSKAVYSCDLNRLLSVVVYSASWTTCYVTRTSARAGNERKGSSFHDDIDLSRSTCMHGNESDIVRTVWLNVLIWITNC